MSRTQRLEAGPHATAQLELGHFCAQVRICCWSVVASWCPCGVRGCLPAFLLRVPHGCSPHEHLPPGAEWHGNTCHPRAAYESAAASAGLSLMPPQRLPPQFAAASSVSVSQRCPLVLYTMTRRHFWGIPRDLNAFATVQENAKHGWGEREACGRCGQALACPFSPSFGRCAG